MLDFFKSFDKQNTKRVTFSQFHRAIIASGIDVTVTEIGLLQRRYEVINSHDGKGGEVDYNKFCDQINKVFVARGLEKDPRKAVTLSLDGVSEVPLGPANPRLSAVESEDLKDILEQLNFHCSTRGYVGERAKRASRSNTRRGNH